ncbi:aminoacyl tRNA synthase complex-interacting multifunctional protein 1-like [Hydractinia symbiolongicarpus]|uniref:aminoacyl tRNA synthase complex-interacting multifunctional protein 1-like n=1 Tax=Hydractinia symbiolongicarpus TaxID=13093 RepID=UPI00254BEF14|nr:aminoacyl tRNA synthase complex-interacting multifunctional protein 1-like [Hydractinia symbiolongicarpus]
MLFRTATYLCKPNKLHLICRRTLCGMDVLQRRQDEAEQTVAILKQQLVILSKLAEQKQKEKEQLEINKLTKENECLESSLKKLKQELKYYEAQNGVKSIPIPQRTEVKTSVATSEVKEEKKVTEEEKPEKKKEKKPKKEKTPAKNSNASGHAGKPVDVSRLHFKVGKIVDVRKHPDADTLYEEQVDLGEGQNRTVVSGLVKHYTLDEMRDRLAVFMCNLKPQKMRGILSQGMIMCASTPEKVEILNVPESAVPGDRVYCEGFTGEADTQLNPKKKIWETVQPDLCVDADGYPGYKGKVFTIEGKGKCKAPTMKSCPIK